MEEIGSDGRHQVYLGLRFVLPSVRDRLTIEELPNLEARLTMLICGFYYNAGNPSDKPIKFDKDEFLSNVRQQFASENIEEE